MLSGEATAGVAVQFIDQLQQLRPTTFGPCRAREVAVRRDIAVLPPTATAVVIDLRRYERWVLEAHESMLPAARIWSAAFTDSMLSPLAARSAVTFVVSADSVGPFDSHVGTLALLNLVVAEVAAIAAATRRATASPRSRRRGRGTAR